MPLRGTGSAATAPVLCFGLVYVTVYDGMTRE